MEKIRIRDIPYIPDPQHWAEQKITDPDPGGPKPYGSEYGTLVDG
jgi:hypothetical protein